MSDVVAVRKNLKNNYFHIVRSFWTLTGSPNLLRHQAILTLAEKASCTAEQAIFRLAQDMGVTPLAGSKNEQHMKDGVGVEKLPALDPNLSAKILEIIS